MTNEELKKVIMECIREAKQEASDYFDSMTPKDQKHMECILIGEDYCDTVLSNLQTAILKHINS